MKRFPWDILLALVAGLGLGLGYAWMISPLSVTNADPGALRSDFKEQYRSVIAASYAAVGSLPRARARLQLLKDPDPVAALNAQAQQLLARGEPPQRADQVAALARALAGEEAGGVPASKPATPAAQIVEQTPSPASSQPPPELTPALTEMSPAAPIEATQPALSPPAPRPSKTFVPTQGASFKLTGQDEICDPNLPNGLLQVIVMNSSRRQIPGMEIDITWEDGEEKFFTGLRPELGSGYADFVMSPDVSYRIQLAAGSDAAAGLAAPACQTPGGESYYGGIRLTFQQR